MTDGNKGQGISRVFCIICYSSKKRFGERKRNARTTLVLKIKNAATSHKKMSKGNSLARKGSVAVQVEIVSEHEFQVESVKINMASG